MKKRGSISSKLIAIVFILACVMVAVIMPQVYQQMFRDKEEGTRNVVDAVFNLLDNYQNKVAKGEMTLEQAKKSVTNNISALRYDRNNYIWINDLSYKFIMHPVTTAEKAPQWYRDNGLVDYKDPNGFRLFHEIIVLSKREGQGFLRYSWPKPGEKNASPKIAYVRLFEPWGWIVGTGVYVDDIMANIRKMLTVIAIATLVIMLIMGVISMMYARSLSRNMMLVVKQAEQIASGDLNVERTEIKSKDETGILVRTFGKMIDSLKSKMTVLGRIADGDLTCEVEKASESDSLGETIIRMRNSLNDIMGVVNASVVQVSNGANQVSSASQELSQGASEQASSLEEITSSVTEIGGMIRKNTDNATAMNGLAKDSREKAEEGNGRMTDLVSAMEEINRSADEIKKIVKTIDDIAFQINLLALNANVEAARAGKYGKGFAVVAEEVRNLAVRSADSVRDTNRMVEGAIRAIVNGNSLVEVTSKQLREIVEGAAKVAEIAAEVATASQEQTLGLDQIGKGLNQIDQVTQQNTASAEECASASEELAGQAQQLKGIISRFKLRADLDAKDTVTEEMIRRIRKELSMERKDNVEFIPLPDRSGKGNAGKEDKSNFPRPEMVVSQDRLQLDEYE